jgi:predicted AAA+ superfamily ATPase
MPSLPSIFDQCRPRPEVRAGELPDAIFAADLWEVFCKRAHPDYQDPVRFFTGTHPTENLKLLVKEVTERLAGMEGGTPIFRLETGFGGGKSHALIATIHVAREGVRLAERLSDYRIDCFPEGGVARVAAFVGEESDPLRGQEHEVDGQRVRTYTPWGQIALLAGGIAGYNLVRENDEQGIVPGRGGLREAFGDQPVLILLDELVLYMARAFALREDHPRSKVNSQ